jgi:hypothetical protein
MVSPTSKELVYVLCEFKDKNNKFLFALIPLLASPAFRVHGRIVIVGL